ncbi:helix-turn-helix transcriptional regulator [Massilia pseudoviolaceinigra]|uniref:helix-turn-helix transcriptional regulator n=1 Tax=Massilia pseudoviolaceinigra TaxID=3057165 RepID=UPI002796D43C|nr:DNA-binding protein [Massilia sp. CCM 9206]MDQ1923414.1 DNA-binding protein [Massilia sp. CCM 9206]
MNFLFELTYQLSSDDNDQHEIVERLGEEGCTDALVGIGHPGRVALEFIRHADNAFAAMTSALADVRRAIPTAVLIEVRPDLVGLTDIAEFAEVSRQNMRKLAYNNAETFPVPVHAGSTTLWHLDDVLRWMMPRGTYPIEPGTLEVASIAKQLNFAIQARQIEPELFRQVQALLA